jgi:hypothetical protein
VDILSMSTYALEMWWKYWYRACDLGNAFDILEVRGAIRSNTGLEVQAWEKGLLWAPEPVSWPEHCIATQVETGHGV